MIDRLKRVIIITGVSGSGKSCVLKTFEDLGYETIDNLPFALLKAVIKEGGGIKPLVVHMDTRTRDFHPQALIQHLKELKQLRGVLASFLFLDCDQAVIMKRYRETRRHHPLATEGSLAQSIEKERRLFGELKLYADCVIDTSSYSSVALRSRIGQLFGFSSAKKFEVVVVSFAYPQGVPQEADMVFDMRFLSNPFYHILLKEFSGLDHKIQEYFEDDQTFHRFFVHFQGMTSILLPSFKQEGRDYFTLAFGCTGGRHRSVYAAEQAQKWLRSLDYVVRAYHRDLPNRDM